MQIFVSKRLFRLTRHFEILLLINQRKAEFTNRPDVLILGKFQKNLRQTRSVTHLSRFQFTFNSALKNAALIAI